MPSPESYEPSPAEMANKQTKRQGVDGVSGPPGFHSSDVGNETSESSVDIDMPQPLPESDSARASSSTPKNFTELTGLDKNEVEYQAPSSFEVPENVFWDKKDKTGEEKATEKKEAKTTEDEIRKKARQLATEQAYQDKAEALMTDEQKEMTKIWQEEYLKAYKEALNQKTEKPTEPTEPKKITEEPTEPTEEPTETTEGNEGVNRLDSARRNLDIVMSGEGVINGLGIKLGAEWRDLEKLAESLEDLAGGKIKELPGDFEQKKLSVIHLRDRLQEELNRDENKRYESSNERLITNPEAEKILNALDGLIIDLGLVAKSAESQGNEGKAESREETKPDQTDGTAPENVEGQFKPGSWRDETDPKSHFKNPEVIETPSGGNWQRIIQDKPDTGDTAYVPGGEGGGEEPPGPLPPELPDEITEPPELVEFRKEYVKMLMKNGRIWWPGRPKDAEEFEAENNYHEVFRKFVLDWANGEVARLHPELLDKEREEQILSYAAVKQSHEIRELARVGSEIYRESRYKKAIGWLRRHSKLRMIAGVGLAAGSIGTAALGLWPATAACAAARGALAGAGTAVGVEGTWDFLKRKRDLKKGGTSVVSETEVSSMLEEETMRRLSAHLAKALEEGRDFDQDPETAETIKALEGQRHSDINKFYQERLGEGMTADQVIGTALKNGLQTEHREHMAETRRRGNSALRKRVTALGAGAAVGLIVGMMASGDGPGGGNKPTPGPEVPPENPADGNFAPVGDINPMKPGLIPPEAPPVGPMDIADRFSDFETILAHKPEGEPLKHFTDRLVRMVMKQTGENLTSVERKVLSNGLYDMIQGPGKVPGSGVLINHDIRGLGVDKEMIKAAFNHPRLSFPYKIN